MSRIHYTVTFPAASPGDDVTWPNTVNVYADKDTQVPLQSGQTLNEARSFSGWSDATSIVFTRPAGTNDTVTVTSGSPSGTGAAAPTPTGGSSLILDSHMNLGLDNGAQTIPYGGDHPILYDTVEGTHGTGDFTADTTAGTITVLRDGLYLIQWLVSWADNPDGLRLSQLVLTPNPDVWNFVASAAQNSVALVMVPTASGFHHQMLPTPVPLPAGTVLSVTANQTSGVSVDVTYAELTVARLL